MNWNQIVNKVTPFIVKIETPSGFGTGFLGLYNDTKDFCGIATALHVVQEADEWKQPIKIHHYPSGMTAFLNERDRVIFPELKTDSAVILVPTEKFKFPQEPIPFRPIEPALPIGVEVGWLGYPGIVPYTLSFFSGIVSARQENRSAYLIDGVAINGVSGGPVIYSTETEGVQIVGIISAYMANRARGDALPGLSFAQDVSHFHDIINKMRTIDEANRKKRELEAQQAKAATSPQNTPVAPPLPPTPAPSAKAQNGSKKE